MIMRNVHISLLAANPCTPCLLPESSFLSGALIRYRSSSVFSSSFIAFRPAGVAAHPSPRQLDKKLRDMYLHAFELGFNLGNRNRRTGRILPESCSTSPAFSAIFITPVHIAVTPAIEIHKVTASLEEETAASVTA